MVFFANLRAPLTSGARKFMNVAKGAAKYATPVRNMGGNNMTIVPTSFHYTRLKDEMHFFTLLGLIPCGAIITYANLFIGPAELKEIPEGYVPEAHEYVSHPIERFLQKYFYESYEKVYEKSVYYIFLLNEERKSVILVSKVRDQMRRQQDEHNWYFVPMEASHDEQNYIYQRQLSNRTMPR